MSKYSFSTRSKKALQGVHPDLVRVAYKALELGVMDFTVTDGVRTKKEQEALYAQGRTTEGPVVTWTLNSKHLLKADGYGYAVDIAPYPSFYANPELFYKLAGLMKAAAAIEGVEIEWGGDWRKKDLPHFQLTI